MRPLTRSCFLLPLLGRLFLLALPFLLGICFPSLWSSRFLLHAPALISLSLAKVRLSHTLTLSPLTIWYSGLTALFLFFLARATLAYLPTALSVALRPLFSFVQAQYVQAFPLKPAPFYKLFAGLGNTNKSAASLPFYLTLVLSSLPRPLLHLLFYLKLSGKSGRNCLLSSFSIRLQWVPGHLFLPGNDAADELARRGALHAPSAIPCSLSSLISRICSSLFSDWRRFVLSKFYDTQVPSISTEELVLPRHARCVLFRLRCNGHSLLLSSYLFSIGRIKNSSCSAGGHSSQDTSHLILSSYGLFAPLTLWKLSVSLQPLVQALGSCPASGAPWSSAMPSALGRGRVINNNNNVFKNSGPLKIFRLGTKCTPQTRLSTLLPQ